MNENLSIENVVILIIVPKIEININLLVAKRSIDREVIIVKYYRIYRSENADLSNENIVKAIWLVKGF
jgi:hypothetical protein